MLIAVVIASLSNAIALLVRQQEALIGISQFIVLPLQFLSSAIMETALAPGWVQHVARYNPVDWAVVASRAALSAHPSGAWSGPDWRCSPCSPSSWPGWPHGPSAATSARSDPDSSNGPTLDPADGGAVGRVERSLSSRSPGCRAPPGRWLR